MIVLESYDDGTPKRIAFENNPDQTFPVPPPGQPSLWRQMWERDQARLNKVNESTVGEFNEKTETQAISEKSGEEGDKSVFESVKEWVSDAAEKTKDAVASVPDKLEEAAKNAPARRDEIIGKITSFLDDATTVPPVDPDEHPMLAAVGDMTSKVKDSVCETFNEVTDSLKDNFCAAMPFPQCAMCSKRPASQSTSVPDYMKMIGDYISSVEKGLEDLATAIVGCPGLVQSAKAGLLSGDFSGMVNSVKNAATSAAISTAVSVGASKALGAVSAIIPDGLKQSLSEYGGKLFGNAGPGGYASLAATMTGLAIAGDSIFTAVSSAKRGNYMGAYGILKGGGVRPLGGGPMIRSNGQISTALSPLQALTRASSNCLTSGASLTRSTKVPGILTRGGYTAYQISTLPGTTADLYMMRRGYADYYRARWGYRSTYSPYTYTNYRQRGTRIRTYKSRSLALF